MIVERHYLTATAKYLPLRTNIKWNDQGLSPALQDGIKGIVSWSGLDAQSRSLFRGFVPSGGRSYICILSEPIETPVGPSSAVKLKAIGKTDFSDPHPPKAIAFDHNPSILVVSEEGQVSVGKGDEQPLFGATLKRAEQEDSFIRSANSKGLPAPIALGMGEYSDLAFGGAKLGFNMIALCDWKTDIRRLGNIFQNGNCQSPEEYLLEIAGSFFNRNAGISELENLFYEAGRAQRRFNDGGLIPNDCHAGNFALTGDARAVLNDFGKGKIKDELNPAQTSIYQLLDINRFLFSAYRLMAWPTGSWFISRAYPLSAYLEGYFGRELFERHLKAIGTPEKMFRGLLKPEIDQHRDKNGFKGSMEIMKYSWTCLYDALQDVLAAEGNTYPLSMRARIEKHIGIYRSFFGD